MGSMGMGSMGMDSALFGFATASGALTPPQAVMDFAFALFWIVYLFFVALWRGVFFIRVCRLLLWVSARLQLFLLSQSRCSVGC